jgi:oligosaccharide repeat unit polymerase
MYFGTLPFLASFSFDEVNYNDATHIFKYKHNFYVKANSIFLSGYLFYLYLVSNRKIIFLYGYLFIIIISLLYITRSTLVSIGVTSLIIYLSFYKIKIKHIIIGLALLVCFLYIFDKLYFLRNKADINFYLNHYENYGFWKSVSRGAEGFYIYLASPVSNLLYNIDIGTFKNIAFHPLYLIEGFFPTKFVQSFIGENFFNTTIVLPGVSNTFTTYPPLLFAFGIYGTVFFMSLLGILFKYIYLNVLLNPSKWFLVLVFVNHIVFLSLFSTSLINPVFFFPIILSYFFPPVKISLDK